MPSSGTIRPRSGRSRTMRTRNAAVWTAAVTCAAAMRQGQGAPPTAQAPITMKLSTATVNDTQHEWLKRFAAAVEKDSGGRIKGEGYAYSQLGSIPRQIEGTPFNSIQA